ncbi:Alpha/beta hydrolase domain-containing protein 11 [Mactra antiquata]
MLLKTMYRKSSSIVHCLRCSCRKYMSTNSSAVGLSYYSYEKKIADSYEKQPLVILHGMMGSKQNWQSLAKAFGKTGRKVLALDARNHGESTHTEDMNYFLFRDDLLKLMDEQDLEQAVLIGHSMGGKTAMVTALQNAERVSGLIIVDVSPAISPNVNKTPAYLEAMLKVSLSYLDDDSPQLSKIRRQVVNELAEAIQDEPMRHFLASNLTVKDNALTWKCNLDSIINNFNTLASFPKFEDEQYYGDTLFIGGMRSNYIHIDHYPKIKALFPTAEIKMIPDAGHWVHADKPEQFINTVNDFLKESGL